MTYLMDANAIMEAAAKSEQEIIRLRDGLRDLANYGQTYGGQKCADIAYEMLTGEKPDVGKDLKKGN